MMRAIAEIRDHKMFFISLSSEYKYRIRFLKVALCLFDPVRLKPVVQPFREFNIVHALKTYTFKKNISRVRHVYISYSIKMPRQQNLLILVPQNISGP
jgi:hypothetical protein